MEKILSMLKGKKTYIAGALCILQAIITDAAKLSAIHSLSEALAYLQQLSGTPAGELINLALIAFGLRLAIPSTPAPVALPDAKVEEPAAVVAPAAESKDTPAK